MSEPAITIHYVPMGTRGGQSGQQMLVWLIVINYVHKPQMIPMDIKNTMGKKPLQYIS